MANILGARKSVQFPTNYLDKVCAQILREDDLDEGVDEKVHGGEEEYDEVADDDGPFHLALLAGLAHSLEEVDDRRQEEVHHAQDEGDEVARHAHQKSLVPAMQW